MNTPTQNYIRSKNIYQHKILAHYEKIANFVTLNYLRPFQIQIYFYTFFNLNFFEKLYGNMLKCI